MLIEAGANVNANANSGERALLSTALFGLVKSIKILIEAGADVNAGSSEKVRTDHIETSAELAKLSNSQKCDTRCKFGRQRIFCTF